MSKLSISGYPASLVTETDKIDNAPADGLLGTQNSLSYRVAEIERHLHSGARWFEKAIAPVGETHVADRIGTGISAFSMDSGDHTWGDWEQILGPDDTPATPGRLYFDPHLLAIASNERAGVYFVQFARGATGDAGIAAGTYTELALDITIKAGGVIVPIQTGRAPVGIKLWARCMCPAFDTGLLNFFFGIHEYEG